MYSFPNSDLTDLIFKIEDYENTNFTDNFNFTNLNNIDNLNMFECSDIESILSKFEPEKENTNIFNQKNSFSKLLPEKKNINSSYKENTINTYKNSIQLKNEFDNNSKEIKELAVKENIITSIKSTNFQNKEFNKINAEKNNISLKSTSKSFQINDKILINPINNIKNNNNPKSNLNDFRKITINSSIFIPNIGKKVDLNKIENNDDNLKFLNQKNHFEIQSKNKKSVIKLEKLKFPTFISNPLKSINEDPNEGKSSFSKVQNVTEIIKSKKENNLHKPIVVSSKYLNQGDLSNILPIKNITKDLNFQEKKEHKSENISELNKNVNSFEKLKENLIQMHNDILINKIKESELNFRTYEINIQLDALLSEIKLFNRTYTLTI